MLGDARTAEELGRAFPGTTVRTSSGDRVLAAVEARPAIVVATPGAEPVAEGGYAAVVLLDTWLPLARADLRAAEEALRRWAGAAGLADPADRWWRSATRVSRRCRRWSGGTSPGSPSARSRQRPRRTCPRPGGWPPSPGAGSVDDALTLLALPASAEVLGPVDVVDPRAAGL